MIKTILHQSETRLWIAALGNRIRHFRKKAGLTQRGLGKVTAPASSGTNACTWETGVSAPSSYELPLIANALGVTIAQLMGEEPEVITRQAEPAGAAPMVLGDADRQVLKSEIQGMVWNMVGELVEIITDTAISTLQAQGVIAQPQKEAQA